MRAVFFTSSSPGFVSPTRALSSALARRGHDVVVVAADALRSEIEVDGVRLDPGGLRNQVLFESRLWGNLDANLAHCMALRRAMGGGVDLLVAHHLNPAAYLMAEICHVPLVAIGGATWIWPLPVAASADQRWSRLERIAERGWRLRQWVRLLNQLRARFKVPPAAENDVTQPVGDLHLLRTIPALEPWHAALPAQVHLVGPLLAPPGRHDAGLERWLQADRGRPVVYAQLGGQFGERDAISLIEPLWASGHVRAVLDVGRLGVCDPLPQNHPCLFVRPRIEMDQVLPIAQGAILSAHPTGVLGSLLHGKPMLLLPNGSGTEELAARCQEAGVATVLESTDGTPAQVAAAWAELVASDERKTRAAWFARRFAACAPAEHTALLLEAFVATRGRTSTGPDRAA